MRSVSIRPLIGAVIFLTACATVHAGTINLAWDPVSGAAGYRVYYGSSSGSYSQSVDVGNNTQGTVTVGDCQTWYLAVKAYNNAGESPNYSNEISGWAAPRVSSTTPSAAQQGAQLSLDVNGANFRSGAAVATDNPNVFLGAPSVQGCNRIQVATTIEPTAAGVRAAEAGALVVSVDNPDGTYDDGAGVFNVQVNPARFDLVAGAGPSQNRLDGRDTIMLSTLFGSRDGDAVYDPDADFDGDGWVDGQDLAYLAGNLGKCWNGSNWTIQACPSSLQ
jgi:hypothetical protein